MSLFYIAFVSLCAMLAQASYNPHMVVEGFYWDEQGEYSHRQRRLLISQLPQGSIYFYLPQQAETLQIWDEGELLNWKGTKTLCDTLKVQLVIGIRTFKIDNLELVIYKIEKKIRQLDVPFVLGWDDVEDGETEAQKKLQLQVLQRLTRKPWAIVPSAYYGEDGDMEGWIKRLSIISDADKSIPFILCSKDGINPSRLNTTTDFPPLGRKMIFWDNWMATDDLTRFPRNLPRDRDHRLFDVSYNYGYMLNLYFPPERIIHGIKSISYQQKNQEYNYHEIAHSWATYLIELNFIKQTQRVQMESALYELIFHYEGTMEVKDIVKQYPILMTFLYDG